MGKSVGSAGEKYSACDKKLHSQRENLILAVEKKKND